MTAKYALITADYVLEKKKPVVLLFCRHPTTLKRRIIRVHNFKPYLYIQPKHFFLIPKTYRIEREDTKVLDIFRREVTKINVGRPSSVARIRKFFTKSKAPTWEADVLFPLRYMINKEIYRGVQESWKGIIDVDVKCPPRALYYDIEVLSKRGTKVSPRTDDPIITITIYDNYTGGYTTFYVHNKILPSSVDDCMMIRCATEKELLLQFIRKFRQYDPDLIVGFYNQRYDDVKIFSRMRALHIDTRLLSPVRQVQDRGDDEGIIWKGRECLDLYWAYRILNPKELLAYSLDHVCLIELGQQKVPIFDFVEDWLQTPAKVIERNQRDVELMVRLNDKLQMIEYFDENRRMVGCRFQDIFKRSRVADILLLRHCHREGIALPSKWEQESRRQIGAIVFEPIPGIYENILYLDFTAMYPTIVIAFNICPTTFSPYEGIPVSKERGYYYVSKEVKQGIVPALLEKILELRWSIQERMEQAKKDGDDEAYERYFYQQQSVKFQANAIYGVLKYKSFRMYSMKAAESIALMGRSILLIAKHIIEDEIGLPVIYGDTDGLFISAKGDVPLQEESDRIVEIINRRMNERIIEDYGVHDANIQIKEEALVKKLLIPTRKKYAYIDTKGKIKEKGLPTIRSDVSDYAREMVKDIIVMVFEEEDKDKILEYCREKILKVKRGEVHPFEMAVPKRITKDFALYKTKTIHVQAAEYSNKYIGTAFIAGQKPRYIYVSQVPKGLPYHKAIALEEYIDPPEGFIYDWEKMVEHELRGKLEDILNIIGIHWEQVHYHDLSRWFK